MIDVSCPPDEQKTFKSSTELNKLSSLNRKQSILYVDLSHFRHYVETSCKCTEILFLAVAKYSTYKGKVF